MGWRTLVAVVMALVHASGCEQTDEMDARPARPTRACRDCPAVSPIAAIRPLRPPGVHEPSGRFYGWLLGHIEDRRRLVVRDPEAWQRLWPELVGPYGTKVPAPVDFSREVVIVATSGMRSSGGYSISIEDVRPRAGGGVSILVVETEPGDRCCATQALEYPSTVVAVPRFDGEAVFVDRARSVDCE